MLLDSGDFLGAHQVVATQQDFFFGEDADDSDRKSIVKEVATEMSLELAARATVLLVPLRALVWPAPPSAWEEVRRTLSEGNSLLSHNARIGSSLHSSYAMPGAVSALEHELGVLAAKARSSWQAEFATWDLPALPSFFSRYPVGLPQAERSAELLWSDRLRGLSAASVGEVWKIYRADLEPQAAEIFSEAYFRATLGPPLAPDEPVRDRYGRVATAALSSWEAGFEVRAVRGISIAVVSPADTEESDAGDDDAAGKGGSGARGRLVELDRDIPLTDQTSELEGAMAGPAASNLDVVVVLGAASRETSRQTISADARISKYQTGTESEPNPEYYQLQNAMSLAQMEVQKAQGSLNSVSSMYCQGLACIGKLIGIPIAQAKVNEANENLQQVVSALNSTPMLLRKPVYSPYKYTEAELEVGRSGLARYFVADRVAAVVHETVIAYEEKKRFTVLYGVHDLDPDRDALIGAEPGDEQIAKFERGVSAISLNEVLSKALSRPPTQDLGSTASDLEVAISSSAASGFAFAGSMRTGKTEDDGTRLPLYSRRVAVVVGISAYEKFPSLEGGSRDGKAVAMALRIAGFDRVLELYDQDATRSRVLSMLGTALAREVDLDSLALVYFAGHGHTEDLPNGSRQGYIVPTDADPRDPFATAISMETLRALSSRLPAKHVYYAMDSCYSGLGLTRGIRAKGLDHGYIEKMLSTPAVQMITAGAAGEEAIELGSQGVFTKFFLQALQGGGDLDGDGFVTSSEIGTFVKPLVTAASQNRQTPQFGTIRGDGEIVFRVSSP